MVMGRLEQHFGRRFFGVNDLHRHQMVATASKKSMLLPVPQPLAVGALHQ